MVIVTLLVETTDPKYLKENFKKKIDRIICYQIFREVFLKYENCMQLISSSLSEDYFTRMNVLCKFAWDDGFIAIRTLHDYFYYHHISFSALPILYTVKKNNKVNSYYLKNHTIIIYGLWYDAGLSEALN